METFLIMDLSTGETLCVVDGENIDEICERFYIDKKTHVRKIGDYLCMIVSVKKIKTDLELIQLLM